MQLEQIAKTLNSFLDKRIASLPPAAKAGIAAAVLLLPSALFFFLLFSPNQTTIANLRKNEQALKSEIATLKEKTKDIAQFREEKRITAEKFAALTILLPKQKEIPSLLTNISGLGTSSGLEFLSFKPKGEAAKEFYAEIPVDITVNGQYHNLGVFLDRVSKLPRIVSIRDFKIGKPERRGNEMDLNTSFTLVTYRFAETSVTDKGKEKDKAKPKAADPKAKPKAK